MPRVDRTRKRAAPESIAIDDVKLAGSPQCLGEVKTEGARRPACPKQDDSFALQISHSRCALSWLRARQGVETTLAVGVVANQPTLGCANNRIDRTDIARLRIDVVEMRHHGNLVRHGDVAADV